MKRQLAVFASDQVNLQNSRIPAAALMDAEERTRFARLAQGLPAGLPDALVPELVARRVIKVRGRPEEGASA